ncbi:MAG: transmembrane 220 family protein [Flavobacteriales bacterium]|nr:transmembrane 220 family protein [Flavobacteriales bacterium]
MKKSLYILMALVFAAFAYLNLNDPDPIFWVAAYGAVAVLFAFAAFGRADRRISGYLALALGMWMLTMVPGMVDWVQLGMPSITSEMKATEPHIEVVREFLGLLIAVGCLLGLWASTPRGARMGG